MFLLALSTFFSHWLLIGEEMDSSAAAQQNALRVCDQGYWNTATVG